LGGGQGGSHAAEDGEADAGHECVEGVEEAIEGIGNLAEQIDLNFVQSQGSMLFQKYFRQKMARLLTVTLVLKNAIFRPKLAK
jgi:hypothetical protein